MRIIGIALVIAFVLAAGVVDWLDGNNDPAPGKRVVRLWEDNWNKGNYTVPACAKHWPPTCPDSQKTHPVPKCAQHWPPTCRRENR